MRSKTSLLLRLASSALTGYWTELASVASSASTRFFSSSITTGLFITAFAPA